MQFRWRGSWNWKDITERMIATVAGSLLAGGFLYALVRLFG